MYFSLCGFSIISRPRQATKPGNVCQRTNSDRRHTLCFRRRLVVEDIATFMPDATIGPNGSEYFTRFNSLSYTNDSSPTEAFSAMFTLGGMTPIGGTSTGSPSTASGTSATGMSMTVSMSGMSMPTPASTTTFTSTNGSGATKPVLATGLVTLVATVIGASLL
ncbi:hypothetical protein V8E55_008640 [Tylopilus felleus]